MCNIGLKLQLQGVIGQADAFGQLFFSLGRKTHGFAYVSQVRPPGSDFSYDFQHLRQFITSMSSPRSLSYELSNIFFTSVRYAIFPIL